MTGSNLPPGGRALVLQHSSGPALDAHVLAEAMPQQVWTATPDGRLDYVNSRVLAYFGRAAEEVLGDGWQRVVHPDDLPGVAATWAKSLHTGEPYEVEFRLLRAVDGAYRWHLGRAFPIRGADGEIVRWVGTNTDVHEHKLVEDELREQALFVETLNETGSRLAAHLDLEEVVKTVTDAATSLAGAQFGAFFYNVEDQLGQRYTLYTISGVSREHFSQFPMPRNTAVFAPTFNGEGVVRLDDVTQDPRYGHNAPYQGMPNGHLPVRSYLAVPVISRGGEVLGGLFFGHERAGVFTERAERLVIGIAAQAAVAIDNARLYERLAVGRDRLALAQAAGRIGTFEWDFASQRIAWTPELEALYGLAPRSFGGGLENWSSMLHPEDRARAEDDVANAVETGSQFDSHFRIVRPDGVIRHLAAKAVILRDAAGVPVRMIGVNVDVTEREDALADARAAIRARDEFLSIASHELRTPVAAVKGTAQLLLRHRTRGTLEEAKLDRFLQSLLDSSDRLATLTDDLLDVSRLRTGHLDLRLRQVRVDRLVKDVTARYRDHLPSHHRLVEDLETTCTVEADPDRLEQVLTNLLTNAVKYSPDQGHIYVSVRREDGGVRLTVRDEGIGLPPGAEEVIFEPFGRAPNATERHIQGMGLGLHICRGIVQRHCGRIWAESAGDGQGSAFHVWLPCVAAAGAAHG